MRKLLSAFIKRFPLQVVNSTGFTMIELLIVIAILGILAVAVLSAINPIEQINRGRDTGSRSDAEQLLSAMDRFHAFQGYYPWQTGASDTNDTIAWAVFDDSVADANGCTVIEKLSEAQNAGCVGADELKLTFFNRITASTYNPLYLYYRGNPGDSAYVCFAPRSKAFATEAIARANQSSGLPADFPSDAANNTNGECGDDDYCVCIP